MVRYLNPNSGIHAYQCGADFIRIRFADGNTYLYTYESTGIDNIEQMKLLARLGQGLNTYINTTVRGKYAKRE